MTTLRPKKVLVINNNPGGAPGHYTQQFIQRMYEANLDVFEARSVQAVEACAREVNDTNDVGLIVSCGSSVVLTEPVDIGAHITKTTAAVLHFPNAPIVGICFGMQLIANLYGGTLTRSNNGYSPGRLVEFQKTEAATRLLATLTPTFTQWASNFIFVECLPPRFVVTAVDDYGRTMAMEHVHEHVYGVQFHPEVLKEGVKRNILDGIVALVGQNRRAKGSGPLQIGSSCSHPWQCSQKCRRRQAIKKVTVTLTADMPANHDKHLGARLATARREAFKMLQRDHCKAGGITVAALDEAIRVLTQLACAPAPSEVSAVSEIGESCSLTEQSKQDTCSMHDADIRLRNAVRHALQSATSKAAGSSRSTSVGSAQTGVTCGSQATSTCMSHGLGTGSELSDKTISSQVLEDSSAAVELSTLEEADLQLRSIVKEVLLKSSSNSSNSNSNQDLNKKLAAAKRSVMSFLRQNRSASGQVPSTLIATAIADLQKTAMGSN